MNKYFSSMVSNLDRLSNTYIHQINSGDEKSAEKTLVRANHIIEKIIFSPDGEIILKDILRGDSIPTKIVVSACVMQYQSLREVALKAAISIDCRLPVGSPLKLMIGAVIEIGKIEENIY